MEALHSKLMEVTWKLTKMLEKKIIEYDSMYIQFKSRQT